MNRKEFLTKSLSAGIGVCLMPQLLSCTGKSVLYPPLLFGSGNVSNIRGNVSRYLNKGGTVGILETNDGFVVIDSMFPDAIQPVLDGISKIGKPISFLCNTHHHADHTGGNIAFKNLTQKIIAHRTVPELQRKAAVERKNLNDQLYPNILFDKTYTINIGGEKVKAYHFGAAHTFGDVVYHFENANVVHMGDLIFMNMIPVYRPKDGSNSLDWIKVLNTILGKFDNDTLFIFGHADKPETSVGNKVNIREMRDFLLASNDFILKSNKDGKSIEEILKNHDCIPGFENRKSPQRFGDYLKSVKETMGILYE